MPVTQVASAVSLRVEITPSDITRVLSAEGLPCPALPPSESLEEKLNALPGVTHVEYCLRPTPAISMQVDPAADSQALRRRIATLIDQHLLRCRAALDA